MGSTSPQLKDTLLKGDRERLAGLIKRLRPSCCICSQQMPGFLATHSIHWMVHHHIDPPETVHMALHSAHHHVAIFAQTVQNFERRSMGRLG